MRGNGVGIVGMGIALPEQVRTNDWWPSEFVSQHAERAKRDFMTQSDSPTADIDPEVVRHAGPLHADPFRGTRERRVLEDSHNPSDLEATAADRALDSAHVRRDEVDLLLIYSLLPDYPAPLNHALVAAKLGLSESVTALSVAAGCASFVAQFHLASALIQGGQYRTAVIVQSSVMSRITDYSQPSSVLGGDAAVAAVVQRVEPGQGVIAYVQDTRGDLHCAVRLRSSRTPDSPWYRGDLHGDALTAQGGRREVVHEVGTKVATYCRETCARVLAAGKCTTDDVQFLCLSQPVAWFGPACCDALEISQDRTLDTFSSYGHVMAASAPLNLWTAHLRGRLKPGSLVLVYSPGAGFIRSALLFRWSLDRSDAVAP